MKKQFTNNLDNKENTQKNEVIFENKVFDKRKLNHISFINEIESKQSYELLSKKVGIFFILFLLLMFINLIFLVISLASQTYLLMLLIIGPTVLIFILYQGLHPYKKLHELAQKNDIIRHEEQIRYNEQKRLKEEDLKLNL